MTFLALASNAPMMLHVRRKQQILFDGIRPWLHALVVQYPQNGQNAIEWVLESRPDLPQAHMRLPAELPETETS